MNKGTSLKTFFALPMTQALKRAQNRIYKDLLDYARHKTGKPNLEGLTDLPDLEAVCDALLLIKAGAVKLEYTDCLPGLESEGLLLTLKLQ